MAGAYGPQGWFEFDHPMQEIPRIGQVWPDDPEDRKRAYQGHRAEQRDKLEMAGFQPWAWLDFGVGTGLTCAVYERDERPEVAPEFAFYVKLGKEGRDKEIFVSDFPSLLSLPSTLAPIGVWDTATAQEERYDLLHSEDDD